ncbi:GDP-mannose 4,6-dehydratase [Candidatus Woesearchaeota archaeon]|nr:GDP-mannose 4,6-dehydratase [Candidatus Woesearchaeota archaeon]
MKIVVTGGAGFIGNHIAEFYSKQGNDVFVFDNLSRAILLKKNIKNIDYNWNYLKKFKNIQLIKGDIKNFKEIEKVSKNADAIIHAAAQTAVTSSVVDPLSDFETNALGTFNVLEAARRNDVKSIVYCSTNKVYGGNVNNINVYEKELRYIFEKKYQKGISENFPMDLCEHSPYGCSKLTGDLYTQEYGKLYGIKTGVFRMSCIYGTRQFGVEDQGWVMWFTIAALLDKPITIYGDGKQVRDILYITDLVELFDKFINSNLKNVVLNVGGGPRNTLSLLELIELLGKKTGKKINIKFSNWRASDQKVYISDISKAIKMLGWKPKISTPEGIKKIYDWVSSNLILFK